MHIDQNIIYFILTVVGGLVAIMGTVAGLFAAIGYYRQGRMAQKTDVINSASEISAFWKEQANGYKAMNGELVKKMDEQKKDYNEQIHNLAKELAEIKGKFEQSEKQKAEYLSILQNRDPSLNKFIEVMTEYTKNGSHFMDNGNKALERIESKLNQILSDGKVK